MPEVYEEQKDSIAETEQARGRVTEDEIKEIMDFEILGTFQAIISTCLSH